MKTSTLSVFCAFLTFVTVGCGLQEGSNPPPDCASCGSGDAGTLPPGDAGTTASSDAGTTTPSGDGGTSTATAPAPVISPSACRLEFHDDYISGSSCGDVVGSLPGMNWGVDADGNPVPTGAVYIRDSDRDGRLELDLSSIPAGTYSLTYRDRECDGETPQIAWALYGNPETVHAMSADARSFLFCNWYDSATGEEVDAPDTNGDGLPDPSCNLRISVDAACVITGNGNMRDLH